MSKLIERIREAQESGRIFFSLEFFPPKTAAGVENLYDRIQRICDQCRPDWIDITYGPSTAELSVELAITVQILTGVHTMMHLCGTNQPTSTLLRHLGKLHRAGVTNILALRGDPPQGDGPHEIEHAADLVRLIRRHFGGSFGVAVAGYPERVRDHPEEIEYLRQKVEAGADFIVTQFFYDVSVYGEFVAACRAAGIHCPIVPGVMPIQSYYTFQRMTTFVGNRVPQSEVRDRLEPVKEDDEAVKAFGIEYGTAMCRQLLKQGARGLHFYTLNLERACLSILTQLELSPGTGGESETTSPTTQRAFPWSSPQLPLRAGETVRPVFWSNRPRSYVERTKNWDDFPNGRWTNTRSPAFGELRDFHLVSLHGADGGSDDGVPCWARVNEHEVRSERNVAAVFCRFLRGEIAALPWMTGPVAPETSRILQDLLTLNEHGYLTINSQPKVNNVSSSDPVLGWGPPNGRVYQKAYLEFFVEPDRFEMLQVALLAHSDVLTWQAVTADGALQGNGRTVTALTWGVFPGREIVQPTVVDAESFMVWKDEAFALWRTRWRNMYPEGSEGWQVIDHIASTYYLVNVVDHDYMNTEDTIFRVLMSIIPDQAS